jgi:hypothetical protein
VVEGEPQEKEGSVRLDYEVAYEVLDALEAELVEDCEEAETEYREEIDRQNLRQLMDDIERIQRVKMLIEQILDNDTERK